ncbi:MAG: penicillin-binding protein [Clostridiales bacterium]|nr:penicillin-binding protein [Candidatus Cacconaster stercorequi]
MKKVKTRTVMILLLVLLLAAGLILFCVRYVTCGAQWAAFSANDHVYTDGLLSSGQILDRTGTMLYDCTTDTYHEDSAVRRATLHAVGDEDNNISTSVRAALTDQLVGFNPLTGTSGGGHKLYLTLDADLCRTAYEELDGRKGTVGVYNYKTGEILCMVSTPAFDPADPPEISDDDDSYDGVYINRFLSATFTPGSVFKIITSAAALENIPDIMERSFHCDGSDTIGGETVTCTSYHGDMDFYGILANSCNCAYAQLAVELGGETIKQYAESAGLLRSHTVSGLTTAAGSYSIGTAAQVGWSGVGQDNDLVNPCAMMTLMGAIASDGTAVQPRLIAKETSMNGLTLFTQEEAPDETVWSAETCRTLRKMMANNVKQSYGQSNFGDLAICAKSGTAEVGEDVTPHSWFTGFLDDEQHPLAFVVMVENGGSGARVAGSIASAVLQQAVEQWED